MQSTDFQYDEPIEEEREQLAEILKEVPYNLSVACIKLCQVNGFVPLPLEKYYEHILPTFHLLRRTDGSKYQTTSIKTVRSAMTSEKIFERNDDGLYVLNIKVATNFLRNLQKKIALQGGIKISRKERQQLLEKEREKERERENDLNSLGLSISNYSNVGSNMTSSDIYGSMGPMPEKKYKKRKKKDEIEDQNSTGNDSFNELLGKKRQLKSANPVQYNTLMNANYIKKNKQLLLQRPQMNLKVEKYEKGFDILHNLLKIFSRNNEISQKLNFDFENIANEDVDLSDDNPDMNKIIGMLAVFKFFKPFLEKSIDSCKQQERIMLKIGQVQDELNYILFNKLQEN